MDREYALLLPNELELLLESEGFQVIGKTTHETGEKDYDRDRWQHKGLSFRPIDRCLRWWDWLDCNRQKNIRNRVTKRQQLHLTSNEFMQRRRARGEIAAHGGCRI
ncbi:hypothetical protein [Brevibacillus centrosporus]|uniref:hypothetical protein n=1 Tax=Brevibacillus centrosporus TaxID=54910 RepID=UPI00398768F4